MSAHGEFVLDCPVTSAWCLDDEATPAPMASATAWSISGPPKTAAAAGVVLFSPP